MKKKNLQLRVVKKQKQAERKTVKETLGCKNFVVIRPPAHS